MMPSFSHQYPDLRAKKNLWPTQKSGVLEIANRWYRPDLVAIDANALNRLPVTSIAIGAEETMLRTSAISDWRSTIQRSVALNSINYQFWDIHDGEFVRYRHNGKVGAMAMKAAFDAAWENPDSPLQKMLTRGKPLTVEAIRAIFGDIPNPASRAAVFNEILDQRKLDWVSDQVEKGLQRGCLGVAEATQLAEQFPFAYGDEVLKKAQLAISETWVQAVQAGKSVEADLTAFADYQIPNVLRHLGVLKYSGALAEAVDQRKLILENSAEERAIRGASLMAMERMAQHFDCSVAALDHFIWTKRNDAKTPFHLTQTVAY